MCPPCKVAINQGTYDYAELASRLRDLIIEHVTDEEIQNAMLKDLAVAEIEFRRSVRSVAGAFAGRVTSDPDWRELMKEI